MDHKTIAIVEDDINILEYLRILIDGDVRFSVIIAESEPEKAPPLIRSRKPDLVITDLSMPVMSGSQLIHTLVQESPQTLCIVFTIFEDDAKVFEALKAGAVGYILKGSPPRDLIEGIDLVLSGGSPMSPSIARKVMTSFHQKASRPDARKCSPNLTQTGNSLSVRETEVLQLVDQAFSYKDIGQSLFISPNTVHAHIKKIYEKLQAKNRSEALRIARQNKMI